MSVIVVANPKGGVGKSTLATHVAGYYASRGHSVVLGDIDRQQSSRLWLGLRSRAARPIGAWDVNADRIVKPSKGSDRAVLDTLQPSVFDIFATRAFLDHLQQHRHHDRLQIALVGMRVDARTIAADKLQEFVATLGIPVLGHLRDTQNYVHLAARGLTLFDLAPQRVEKDLAQWQPICDWLDA